MKILKGKLHVYFSDLMPGDTFISDERPHMKLGQPGGSKLACTYKNSHVDLESGIWYVSSENMKVEKVELGITGLEKSELDN